jgi:hypothetical protein
MSVALVCALDAAYPYVGGLAVVSFLLLMISGKDLFEGGVYSRLLAIVVGVSFLSILAINGIVQSRSASRGFGLPRRACNC